MKTATLPPVRIAPQLRDDIEQALEEGETLTALVETAVRSEIVRRQEQAEFVRRGLAAIEQTEAAGDGVPAAAVIAKLEAKLAAARRTKAARPA
jgi:hypothetical protein